LENDYELEDFPKAGKLLDVLRCTVTFNTIGQLVDGYRGFMGYITNQPTAHGQKPILTVARIKNGFRRGDDDDDDGYRDLKVNVLFRAIDPSLNGLAMICEVQLILNQFRFEKAKMHKLYTIIRDHVYYRRVQGNLSDNGADCPFEWNPARKSKKVELSSNNKKMRSKSDRDWVSVYSKQKLSAHTMKEVLWGVKINDIDSTAHLMIGFVDSHQIDTVGVDDFVGYRGCAFYIISADNFQIYEDNQTKQVFDQKKLKASSCENGDTILMKFDFTKSTCTVSYNDEDVGVVSESIPQELYLGVSPYRPCSLETIQFEVSV